MDLVPLTCLRPNVTQDEAVAALERRAGIFRGKLRQVASAYLPFRLYRVEVVNRGATKSALYGADAVSGVLDLYEFQAAPTPAELITVTTRNAPRTRLDTPQALSLLENKVRRAVFQTLSENIETIVIAVRG